jgi:hypothetical protein
MNKFFALILALMLCASFYSMSPGAVYLNEVPPQVEEFVQGVVGEYGGRWLANSEVVEGRKTVLDITVETGGKSARFVITLRDGEITNIVQVGLDGTTTTLERYEGFINGA